MTVEQVEHRAFILVVSKGLTPAFAVDLIASPCPCPTDGCGHRPNALPANLRFAITERIARICGVDSKK
jgi:hypothetical protein